MPAESQFSESRRYLPPISIKPDDIILAIASLEAQAPISKIGLSATTIFSANKSTGILRG